MKKSKNILKLGAYIVFVSTLVGGIYFGIQQVQGPQKQSDNSNTSQRQEKDKTTNETANQKLVTYKGVKGESALVTLKQTNDSVITVNSDFGEYVDSINNLKGGTDGNYWSFYINGELSSTGADTYIATGEETIEWKFVNLQ